MSKVIGGLRGSVNELTRLRVTRRERYQVSIFGSARIEQGNPYYDAVRDMARSLAQMDCNIITGGGPGTMVMFSDKQLAANWTWQSASFF